MLMLELVAQGRYPFYSKYRVLLHYFHLVFMRTVLYYDI